MKEYIVKSHLKKKSQSKLALSISLFIVILTSTGYIFNSKGVIFLFYISCFVFFYILLIHFWLVNRLKGGFMYLIIVNKFIYIKKRKCE